MAKKETKTVNAQDSWDTHSEVGDEERDLEHIRLLREVLRKYDPTNPLYRKPPVNPHVRYGSKFKDDDEDTSS